MTKSFIYLDKYKMYSLSSQLFEGVTEYMINTGTTEKEKEESQQGKIGSGRAFADILKEQHAFEEKRFLHDYAYVLFEKYLIENGKVLLANSIESDQIDSEIPKFPFLKIQGKGIFNDVEFLKKMMSQFNQFGEALTYVTNIEQINEFNSQHQKALATTKDRNQKTKLSKSGKKIDVAALAKASGLQQDARFLKEMEFLLSYGLEDQLEFEIDFKDKKYTANLKREDLKEKEGLLIRKYGRKTEVDFVIFGIPSQYAGSPPDEIEDKSDFENLKAAVLNMVDHLANIDYSFVGRRQNEIVIDPIAVYLELENY